MTPFNATHICGTLEACDTVARGSKGFQVATLRIRIGDSPDDPAVVAEATHEARHAAAAIPIGASVIIHGRAEAREWQGKWLQAIRIESIAQIAEATPRDGAEGQPQRQATTPAPKPSSPIDHSADDVPF